MTDLHFDIINAIAYSRLISGVFTAGECIALHQWATQYNEPSAQLKLKFEGTLKAISQSCWEKPNLKYTEGYELFWECSKTLTWKKVTSKA